ncbi:hypothetical protein [Neobacillus rhizophilus]|uniref:Uncharacterized protein n=1 Tax=Neobacillus rhizophilus TaxID=2833579 RepID=A0A942YVF7_9BACI|nr:hypothetical protein [Neobacillus rhizophilus]MBS4211486.1 hypothetical protein [Neobacillus rhizophilus]
MDLKNSPLVTSGLSALMGEIRPIKGIYLFNGCREGGLAADNPQTIV